MAAGFIAAELYPAPLPARTLFLTAGGVFAMVAALPMDLVRRWI